MFGYFTTEDLQKIGHLLNFAGQQISIIFVALVCNLRTHARIKTFRPVSIFELRFGSVQIKHSEAISTSLTPSCLYLRCTLQLTFSTTMPHNKFRLHSKDALCENLKSVIWVSRLNYVMIFSIDVSFEEKM